MKTILILISSCLTLSNVFSQGVVNSEKLFNKDVEDFYFVLSPSIDMQKGNSDVVEVGIQLSTLYKLTKKHWLKATGGIDLIQEDGENVANDKFTQLRHTFSINKWMHTFTFYQLQNSFNLGFDKRQLIGSGLRFKLVNNDTLGIDFGLGAMNEYEEYDIDTSLHPEAKKKDERYKITSMLIFRYALETFAFKNVSYFQPNISNLSDFRFLNEFDLTFEINQWLDYEVNYIIRYDNNRPVFLDSNIDQYITSGFNIKFNK